MRNDTTTRCVSYVRIAVTNTTHENSILFLSITSNVLLNVLLFPSMVSMRQGKNNVLIQSVPNPPLSAKCEVCGDKHPEPQSSNFCKNGCFSETGCTKDDDKVKGKKPKVASYLIRVKTGELADELLSKLEGAKGKL
eukprot:m.194303 g.194303  ORF g.194303 m.194303 type:complete len:137 (+) comp10614_c1_seq3:1-411(+)